MFNKTEYRYIMKKDFKEDWLVGKTAYIEDVDNTMMPDTERDVFVITKIKDKLCFNKDGESITYSSLLLKVT